MNNSSSLLFLYKNITERANLEFGAELLEPISCFILGFYNKIHINLSFLEVLIFLRDLFILSVERQ